MVDDEDLRREREERLDHLVSTNRLGLGDGEVRVLVPDPDWPAAFVAIRARIATAIEGARVSHIGSTPVSGMPAKPLVDVSVGLAEGHSLGAEPAAAAGLVFRAVNPEAVLFAPYGRPGLRIANVHVRYRDSDSERWDLIWRDYLRTHPGEVAAYAAVKKEAAARHRGRCAYSASKGRFIAGASKAAIEWAARRRWAPSGE